MVAQATLAFHEVHESIDVELSAETGMEIDAGATVGTGVGTAAV